MVKDCKEVGEWIKSITNHTYWVAASTPNGTKACVKTEELLTAKRLKTSVEAFHSTINQFAPKKIGSPFMGCTAEYVNTLMRSIRKIVDVTTIRNTSEEPMPTPRPLCAAFTRPQKTDDI
ncbi:Hypothetical predicted protein [Mytilus galloprovincialis]|uniref:Uncharacterized protein n=1 Tax=Mytilus galloprovincialis TaxID=29158 RepID=A0A8B6CGJ1_MYTGA|nr:Hypothetical predicted protein [Mytilus galloprovincialis]